MMTKNNTYNRNQVQMLSVGPVNARGLRRFSCWVFVIFSLVIFGIARRQAKRGSIFAFGKNYTGRFADNDVFEQILDFLQK